MKRAACVLVAALKLCAGVSSIFIMAPTALQPAVRTASGLDLSFKPHPGARLPLNAMLLDENGQTVALSDYFSKAPVILVLEYLRCTSLCGVTLEHLIADTLNDIPLKPGRDYQLVAISIDPRDKPGDAATARAKYSDLLRHTGAGLHFLTGPEAAVRQIADIVGFPYQYDPLVDAYTHPVGFVIATPEGVISRYVEGLAITPPDLVAAIADAEQDKSQTLLDRIVLLCHVGGAPLGRFTVPVLAALMLANVAAGLTATAIFRANRRKHYG
jgi:protein SCO1/2